MGTLPSAWTLLVECAEFFSNIYLGLFFYLFPSGRFVPRWTRWLIILTGAYWAINIFYSDIPFNNTWLSFVLFLALIASVIILQIYRLGLLYVGLVIGFQALLRGFISQTNDVAIVVSTLVIAALFQPMRHGIQAAIDRRFYRRKYDAARTLAAFSASLRNEVDLATLREHLVGVVQETMQPAHVSLWLRRPSGTDNSSLRTGKPPLMNFAERKV